MPNVSEMHREALEEYETLNAEMKRHIPKGDKERILRRMQALEQELGIDRPGYNSGDWWNYNWNGDRIN